MTDAVGMQRRSVDDRLRSEELRRQSEAAIRRVHAAADRIRRMTLLYEERLEGIRRG